MKLFVIGATGRTGRRRLSSKLSTEVIMVTAFVRSPENIHLKK